MSNSPLLPAIGGYLIPHENPAVGQQRSKPAWQNVGDTINGVIPELTGDVIASGVPVEAAGVVAAF